MSDSDKPKRETAVQRGRRSRAETLSAETTPITEEGKALLLALVRDGATLVECAQRKDIGTYRAICDAERADATWAGQLKLALAEGARNILAEAHEMARDVSSGDPDAMRVADYYVKAAHAFVEKAAPREYGPLVKIAGDADQAAITVNLVSFATVDAASKAVQSPHAREVASDVASTASDQESA